MEAKIAQCLAGGQRDKGPAFSSLIYEVISRSDTTSIAADLHKVVDTVVNQESEVGLVVGRQVLTELVKILSDDTVKDATLRKTLIEDTIVIVQPRILSYEEQVNNLRHQLANILEEEEEWSQAAHILITIASESGQRSMSDNEKLKLYVRIVRLLLEEEDSVQAETYFNRAQVLSGAASDRVTMLQFKLCQARIMDYSRKFLEAASRYHELSYAGDIDEEERQQMLMAAVTCSVLAPAGPNRSRVLGSLFSDERSTELSSYNILSKMFLDHILRPAEIKEFEKDLKPHQLAKIALSSNDRVASAQDDDDPSASTRTGPSTVLDRAVMEHNLLASSKIYNNITFSGLGALLDLAPSAAETMARKMIEQGRLRASIDQVDKLIWFESTGEDDDAQGKAGGLGDVEEAEDTGAQFTKHWDAQIRLTAANVESIVQQLTDQGLVKFPTTVTV